MGGDLVGRERHDLLRHGIAAQDDGAFGTSPVPRLRGAAGGEAGAGHAEAPAVDADGGAADAARSLPLGVLLLPILVPLLMIAFGAFAELFEFSNPFIAFLGNANLALFVGLLGAYVIFRATAGLESTRETMDEGFHTTGEILLITGVGGSLAR